MTTPSFGPRRFLFSFAVALVCGLAVFALPRAVFRTIAPAFAQTPQRDSAAAAPAPNTAPANTSKKRSKATTPP